MRRHKSSTPLFSNHNYYMREQRVVETLKKLQMGSAQKSNHNQIQNNSQLAKNIQHPKSWLLYLELDINQTEKRFRQYVKDYNQELHNPEFLEEQYQLHKNYKVQVQKSVKSLSIKNTHILTTISIIKAYYTHLKLIERGRIIKEPVFAMNNVAIGTMTGICDRSSRRHVNKLLATGFLQEKVFRGSNASFIIKINPEFLVARPQKKLTDLLINQHIERYPGMPISPITYKHYKSLRPSFTDFPSGIIRTVCPDVAINPDTFNNNILEKGIVDNCIDTKSKRPKKITVINNEFDNPAKCGNPDNNYPEQANVRHFVTQDQSYQQKIQRENKKNFPPALFANIFSFTELAWNFAHSLLYDNRPFQPEQEQAAKNFIAGFFLEFAKNNKNRRLSACYGDFVLTIQIIHDYTRKRVDWMIARPEYFFDPHFKGGFYGAVKDWLPKQKDKQKQTKDWNTNKKKVSEHYLAYSKNPTFEQYRMATQQLGKLKNKKFLEIFNACVLDNSKFNTQFLNQQN